MNTIARSRFGLYLLFLMLGIAMATWATCTPKLKDMLIVSTEQMGFILFGFAGGSMLGILSGAKFVKIFYVRSTMIFGAASVIFGIFILIIVSFLPKQYLAFVGLLLIGFGSGLIDISGNIECCTLQNKINKHLLSTLHASFCIGTLSGSLISFFISIIGMKYLYHLLSICIVLLFISIFGASLIKNISSNTLTNKIDSNIKKIDIIKDKKILMLCIIILGLAFAEGAANDWLPLLMKEGHGFAESTGLLIYFVFTAGMAAGRLTAPIFLRHFRAEILIIFSALFASLGVSLAIFSNGSILGCLSVLFWGLGASLGFPLVISCASYGSIKESNDRVTFVATVGYIAFLVSPPFLGTLGGFFGLRYAMLPVLTMTIISSIIGIFIKDKTRN